MLFRWIVKIFFRYFVYSTLGKIGKQLGTDRSIISATDKDGPDVP